MNNKNTITNRVTREKITWLETGEETSGQRLVFLFEVGPKGRLPVVHLHPDQTESFEMQEGTFTVELPAGAKHLTVGDTLEIPPGVAHRWSNPSEHERALLRVTFSPALNTRTFLEQFFGLSNDGKTATDGSPGFFQLMAMVNRYQIFIAGPPIIVQKLLGATLGTVARLFGVKAYYPKYSGHTPE